MDNFNGLFDGVQSGGGRDGGGGRCYRGHQTVPVEGAAARETSSSPILAEPETVGKDGDGVHFVYLYVDVVSGFEPAFVDASTAVRLATKKEKAKKILAKWKS